MLEHSAHAAGFQLLGDGGGIFCGDFGVLPQGAGVDKVPAVGRYIHHRGKVQIDAVGQQGLALGLSILQNGFQTALLIELSNRQAGPFGKQIGVLTGAHHRATLFIGTKKGRDGRPCAISLQLRGKGLCR